MHELLNETGSDYTLFIEELTELVKERMGEGYTASIYKVTKNNSLELDSLVLLKEGKNFAPNIYLQSYYEAYREGVSLPELVDRLCEIYYNCTTPFVTEKFQFSFEEMKSQIIYRIINYEKNRKLLNQVPHLKYLDLAITFHCLVHNQGEGIGTIRITNEHMEHWKVSQQELKEHAVRNTAFKFPPVIRSMEEVIRHMLTEEYGNEELPTELAQELFHNDSKQHKMYILSNQKGINGATCLLYDNVLKKFADQLHTDLYILPSSIHEVILVPFDNSLSKDSLADMVKDVNLTQVACDEVLSDRVYYYSRKNNTITM